MARALHFLRGTPLLPLSVRSASTPALVFFPSLLRPSLFYTAIDHCHPHENAPATIAAAAENTGAYTAKDTLQYCRSDNPDYRHWKDREAEILKDIEPITFLTKDILHSNRYMDGERLTAEDEKAVVERLLAYHPHSEDKIGCGLDSIMVDRHPQFRNSRCLFVVRTDGGWIDFSYQKCLRAYIREKYPSHAERFVREHFKRS